ncbi:MAG: hypothetical protein V1853_03155 [bacterium]
MSKFSSSQVRDALSKSLITKKGESLSSRAFNRLLKKPELEQSLKEGGIQNPHKVIRDLRTGQGSISSARTKKLWGVLKKQNIVLPKYGSVRMSRSFQRKSPQAFVKHISQQTESAGEDKDTTGHKTDLETIEERRRIRLNKRATIIENAKNKLPLNQIITEKRKLRDDAYEPGDSEDIIKRVKNPKEDQETSKKKLVVSVPIEGAETSYLSASGGGAPLQEASRPENSELGKKSVESPKENASGSENSSQVTNVQDLEID